MTFKAVQNSAAIDCSYLGSPEAQIPRSPEAKKPRFLATSLDWQLEEQKYLELGSFGYKNSVI